MFGVQHYLAQGTLNLSDSARTSRPRWIASLEFLRVSPRSAYQNRAGLRCERCLGGVLKTRRHYFEIQTSPVETAPRAMRAAPVLIGRRSWLVVDTAFGTDADGAPAGRSFRADSTFRVTGNVFAFVLPAIDGIAPARARNDPTPGFEKAGTLPGMKLGAARDIEGRPDQLKHWDG